MDKKGQRLDMPLDSTRPFVFILEGEMAHFSTEALHYHSCHQILRIRSGITLLVDAHWKQPLFSNMTAFIPSGFPHRSVIVGEPVQYKSIYLQESLFPQSIENIVIFDMSDLGVALFERIGHFIDTGEADPEDVGHQCLRLLLKLMETEIRNRSSLTRIPVPLNPDNRKITDYIAKNFGDKIKLSDFTAVLYYSERHLSRIFKDDLKITVFEYLKLYRIFQASLLLSDGRSSKTVTEIAMACGYNSLSSFFKDFKDIFAMTPKAFCEKLPLP